VKKYYYKVYGLILESEIEIPEVPEIIKSEPNATIKIGTVPDKLNDTLGKGVLYELTKKDFLFKLERIAKYRVQSGEIITIQPEVDANLNEIRLFLLGSVFAALLHQKGIFVLHGSAVAKDKKAIIFTGSSSSGKSSVAYGLYKKGYTFVSDDISVITCSDNGTCSIYPGIPQFKLWKDVLNHLKHFEMLNKVRPTIEKYTLPITNSIAKSPIEIGCIISLRTKNSPGFKIEELNGVQKFNMLRKHTYRLQYLTNMQQSLLHFNQLSILSKKLKVFNLERPLVPLNIEAFTDFIESEVLK
jgi:hypothetical protein